MHARSSQLQQLHAKANMAQADRRKRRDFKGVFTELTVAENTGEADLIVHLQRRRQRIADQLRAALGVFKYVHISSSYLKISHTFVQ